MSAALLADITPKIWWYASRSTGIVAWVLAAAAVIWGLLLSTRSARGLAKPSWVLDLHRYLGALSVLMVLAHMGTLMADSFVQFSWADLLVPGSSAWKTRTSNSGVWTSKPLPRNTPAT